MPQPDFGHVLKPITPDPDGRDNKTAKPPCDTRDGGAPEGGACYKKSDDRIKNEGLAYSSDQELFIRAQEHRSIPSKNPLQAESVVHRGDLAVIASVSKVDYAHWRAVSPRAIEVGPSSIQDTVARQAALYGGELNVVHITAHGQPGYIETLSNVSHAHVVLRDVASHVKQGGVISLSSCRLAGNDGAKQILQGVADKMGVVIKANQDLGLTLDAGDAKANPVTFRPRSQDMMEIMSTGQVRPPTPQDFRTILGE